MKTLPGGNGWKLVTTGGAVKAQMLDSCPLTIETSFLEEIFLCVPVTEL